jgi:hypothetical protein
VNILQALDDPSLFGPHFRGPSWAAWRAFLTAAFGLPMDDMPPESCFASARGALRFLLGQLARLRSLLGDAAGNPACWR